MIVKELIAELEQCNPEAVVVVKDETQGVDLTEMYKILPEVLELRQGNRHTAILQY